MKEEKKSSKKVKGQTVRDLAGNGSGGDDESSSSSDSNSSSSDSEKMENDFNKKPII